MRYIVILTLFGALAACGSSRSSDSRATAPNAQLPFATGPIYSACMAADRKAASRRLCGCVQATADRDLSSSAQSRATEFFDDPQKAQDARGSSRFWKSYRAWSDRSKQVCDGA